MKRKLLLAATSLMFAVVGGGGSASAYTVADLENAGWTQVTASTITGTSDNYYVLVDANSSNYVMSVEADHYRPCYKTIDNPFDKPSFVWILEESESNFKLKSYSTGAYFKQSSGWNTSVGDGRNGSIANFSFTLSENKYSIQCIGQGLVGHWNDDGAAVKEDGENIAANKQANNAPGFFLYSIPKATYDEALIAARESAAAGASASSPFDATVWIQNADWSGDWGGWEFSCTSSGNIQWGKQTLESWNASNVVVKQELRGVPNGKYKVQADVISGNDNNKVAYVFGTGSAKVSSATVSDVASAGDYATMSAEVAGKTLTADNIVVTNNTLTIGIDQAAGWIVADNFKLYYYGEDLSIYVDAYNEAVTAAKAVDLNAPMLVAAKSALQTAISNYGTGVDTSNKDALLTATSALGNATTNATTSIAAYAPMAPVIAKIDAALEAATSATASTDDYDAIKTAYNNGTIANADIPAQIIAAYEAVIPVIKSQTAASGNFTLAVQNQSFEYGDMTGWTATSSSDTGVRSTSNAQYAATGSDGNYLFNTWWQGVPITQSVSDLPNGQYTLTASVASDGATIYLIANGEHNEGTETGGGYPDKDIFQDASITFLVKDGTATIGAVGGADGTAGEHKDYVEAGYWWYKADNFRLVKNRDLTEEEAIVIATAEDLAALNAAIEAAEAKTLGFLKDEYAPYNNIDALAALAAAKAIDQTDENLKQEDVQSATAALTGATWTENAAEVNAIFDGSFAHDYSGQSGNVQPIGWYRNEGTYTGDGYNVRYVSIPNGVTASNHGLFGKFTMQYGKEPGYTLPLKAGYYKLEFSYGGYGEQGERTVKLIGENETTIDNIKAKNNQANTKSDAYTAFSQLVEVPADGDYVLSFYRQNTTSQNQIAIVDIKLFRATTSELKEQLLAAEIQKAENINVNANVGTSAFQIPATFANDLTSALNGAQTVYEDASASIDDVLTAVEDLKTAETSFSEAELNAPDADKVYNITNVSSGYNHANKAVTFKSASNADLTANTTSMGWTEDPGSMYPQGVKFTAVAGKKNVYTLSYTRADGKTIYISTGKTSGLGDATTQIRPTTDATKALEVRVEAAGTEDVWYLWNTEADKRLGANGANDQGLFTGEANGHNFYDMKLAEAVNNEVALNLNINKYGTLILPFNADVPTGVKAYSVSEISGTSLTLVENNTFVANTPYIVYAENGATGTLAGLGAAYTDDSYTEGLLTGIYSTDYIPQGSYVLQTQDGVQAFYLVDGASEINGVPNRAYLTLPNPNGGLAKERVLFLEENEDATFISVISALTTGEVEAIYSVGGAPLNGLQKGINIVKMRNGETKKVLVK